MNIELLCEPSMHQYVHYIDSMYIVIKNMYILVTVCTFLLKIADYETLLLLNFLKEEVIQVLEPLTYLKNNQESKF